jgi:hypothetical protein
MVENSFTSAWQRKIEEDERVGADRKNALKLKAAS